MLIRLLTGVIALFLLLLPSGRLAAQNAQPSESELKAAFLYNFAKFVAWPQNDSAGRDSLFIIGIIGDNPFQGLLKEAVEGNSIRSREVRVMAVDNIDSLSNCQVLFVSSSEKDDYAGIIGAVADQPVLTVGEDEDFSDAGGIIAFYIRDNRVRFRIDVEAAAAADLNISSKLLKLAELR